MFTDDPNIIKLADKIFLYKNFFTPEEVAKVNEATEGLKTTHHYFDHIDFRPTYELLELFPVWEKISDFLYPEFVIHPMLSMLQFNVGNKMDPHCDSPGEGHEDDLTVPDVWSTCCLLSWGVCGYFGDFEGGEVYYPNQDLEVAVRPGDLVIHGALSDCMHGVKEVTKGTRYVYTNFSLRADKNPGSFPNYKTPEYYEAIKDMGTWANPKFVNPQSVELAPIDGRLA
jgi:hypothetical protein